MFAKYEASNMHQKSYPVQNLLACKKGLWLAHQWCESPVILESDCSNFVVALAKHKINRSIYASLVENSENIMRMLENVRLVKFNREQNIVAHELAQHARRAFSSEVWLLEIPSYIQHVVLLDCNVT